MEGFLEGFRILDVTDSRGHLCGRILGDMGADVIKIEPPGGDASRETGPFYHDESDPEKSLNWFYANANKRGITLDLESPRGKDIFQDLVKGADLVIESFVPQYMASIGLGYESLSKIKPDIILTSITPFGQDGPYSSYAVTDLVVEAMGGMVYAYGDPDRPPVRISAPQSYFLGSQHAAAGSMTALYHREMTGVGQCVDVSMQEAITLSLTYFLPYWDHHRIVRSRGGSETIRPRPDPQEDLKLKWLYPCRDGYVCLTFQGAGTAPVKSSRAIVAWANEEGFAEKIAGYNWETWDSATIEQKQQDLLQDEIAPFIATKTRAELLEGAAGRRILLAPVNAVSDLPDNPQFAAREFWQDIYHPELNDVVTYPGPSVKVDACPQRIFRRAPIIGEHNGEIYGDELGMAVEERRLLQSRGVI
ncbi:MAG: CoA transferase [Desulfobacterales bacterium]